ncbi:MAG: hypothetical protein V1664_05645 [Candidatus Uhrbacteria bacterium]
MSDFWRIILGFVIIGVGFHMVWKTVFYQDWTGRIDFAEEKFGPGGTNTFLKLFGTFICFIGVATATNLISDILMWLTSFFIRR